MDNFLETASGAMTGRTGGQTNRPRLRDMLETVTVTNPRTGTSNSAMGRIRDDMLARAFPGIGTGTDGRAGLSLAELLFEIKNKAGAERISDFERRAAGTITRDTGRSRKEELYVAPYDGPFKVRKTGAWQVTVGDDTRASIVYAGTLTPVNFVGAEPKRVISVPDAVTQTCWLSMWMEGEAYETFPGSGIYLLRWTNDSPYLTFASVIPVQGAAYAQCVLAEIDTVVGRGITRIHQSHHAHIYVPMIKHVHTEGTSAEISWQIVET